MTNQTRGAHQTATGHTTSTTAQQTSAPGLDLTRIRALAARPPELTLSILLPTHRSGSDRIQDRIRLRNLIHDGRQQLADQVDKQQVGLFDAGLEALLGADATWEHPAEGLALFATATGVEHFWTPQPLREQVLVCAHCHLKPLMPLLAGDGLFSLLELTRDGAHLHYGSRFTLTPISTDKSPLVPADVHPAGAREHLSGVRGVASGNGGAVRHFGATHEVQDKELITCFFRHVDAVVCARLHAEQAPLVVAGVGYLLPLYAEVNRYPHMIALGVPGNPEHVSRNIMHERAWSIVAPLFAAAAQQAAERYAHLRGGDLASNDLATVMTALRQGRVGDLFLAADGERWGGFSEYEGKVAEHLTRAPGDDDLLNLALIAGLATRSRIQVVPRAEMPDQGDIAAVFRY